MGELIPVRALAPGPHPNWQPGPALRSRHAPSLPQLLVSTQPGAMGSEPLGVGGKGPREEPGF